MAVTDPVDRFGEETMTAVDPFTDSIIAAYKTNDASNPAITLPAEERSDEAIQPLNGARGTDLVEVLDRHGALRAPRDDKGPGRRLHFNLNRSKRRSENQEGQSAGEGRCSMPPFRFGRRQATPLDGLGVIRIGSRPAPQKTQNSSPWGGAGGADFTPRNGPWRSSQSSSFSR